MPYVIFMSFMFVCAITAYPSRAAVFTPGGVRVDHLSSFLCFLLCFISFYLRVSCVSNAASVSRLSILYYSFGFL